MKIKHRTTRRRLPEDDPTLVSLVADLKALHHVSTPRNLRPRLAGDLKRQLPTEGGMIPFPKRKRAGAVRPGGRRRWLTQGIAAAMFIAVLALASGALTFSVRQATTSRSAFGASGPVPGIPKGAKIKLTIDNYVQSHIVEPTLTSLIRQFKAVSGTIVVERPSDGAIIAMDSQPRTDSRTWQQVAASDAFGTFANPASSDAFTPGQTVMPLLAAIGFDTGSFNERTTVDDSGLLKVDGITIQNWCADQCAFGGPETTSVMLHYASNVAATLLAKLIPDQEFYEYLDSFGFGRSQTGLGLPKADPGTLIEPYRLVNGKKAPNHSWRPAYRDLTAFGQGVGTGTLQPGQKPWKSAPTGEFFKPVITTTPLQLTNAYAALANGGTLMQPHLVQSYSLNGKTTIIQPTVLNVVFKNADTAQRVTNLLVQAEINGEACEALVRGYDVVAKTGDADIYNANQPNAKHVIVYAMAYGPIAEADPARRFVVLIEMKDPNKQWGSETAAPGVSKILHQLFQRYGLQPDPKSIQPNRPCSGPDTP
jgi:cell division protein FtsI/penicillin-binding protein 2